MNKLRRRKQRAARKAQFAARKSAWMKAHPELNFLEAENSFIVEELLTYCRR